MNKSEFVKIPFKKATLYFTYPQFVEALRRGKAFTRAKERRRRENRMHQAAERRRNQMMGMPEVL